MFTQFGPTWPTLEGEIDLSNPLSMSSYKEIQMGYKKLASTSSKRTTLISTHFSISPMNKTLNDFHYLKRYYYQKKKHDE